MIGPAEDRFSDEVQVSLTHNDPAVELRYTLDGTDPRCDSPVYGGPIRLQETTVVKTRAFRKIRNHSGHVGVTLPPTSDGTKASAVVRAVFTKEAPWEPVQVTDTKPGLAFTYYEDDGTWPISAFNLDALKPVGSGTCTELFDVSATKRKDGGFAFIYTGYLDIAKDGVYSFHAPREFITPSVHAGYDLRVFLDNREWYPATQVHNFGVWSVPLKAGKHGLQGHLHQPAERAADGRLRKLERLLLVGNETRTARLRPGPRTAAASCGPAVPVAIAATKRVRRTDICSK